jgi:mannose-6-phosphate isomerase
MDYIMTDLYPLRFEPVLKEKIWGGDTLQRHFGKKAGNNKKIGESWEISGLRGDLSIVSNGFLAGNSLEEIIEVYMGDITGDIIYDSFGVEFPLMIKLLDAREVLSIQVHPDNDLAKKRHNAHGKTEMWYILEALPDSKIYWGFSETIDKEVFLEHLNKNKIQQIINTETIKRGESYFIPAGMIHAISGGTVLAEIQQTSDITYRIFDWNRIGANGTSRELNSSLAIDALDFQSTPKSKIKKEATLNKPENLIACEFFSTNVILFNQPLVRDYNLIDSFVIYICTDGEFILNWDDKNDSVKKGDTILLPAMIKNVVLEPKGEAKLLEVFIDDQIKK